MIRTLLIANRGEIAVRIARTARAMGIATVAVHSDADAGALHTAMCDRAVRIGPPPPALSYLDGAAIVAAALRTGADAVHPGYGFLSENPGFAEAVLAAGLVWVGPPPAAIRAMGLKDSAKRLMEGAGVPVTPGYHGSEQDPNHLAAHAEAIGWPVLIKAAAGGGGKGMRRVDRPQDFAQALERARSEAQSSFGNPQVLVEKLIDNPRHVEVQVFADTHGNAVHLYERDCSAQRRHQKVMEEAPAPGMTPALREAMTGAAVRAAQAVGYVGAGTVEFILDGGRMSPDGFYFMEMNTRLQVEHPVTEAVTGLDLVEWQLRVAAGEPLPLAQRDIALNGHALEARLYAEDPAADFFPQSGLLAALAFPGEARVESGVRAGDTVTPHYDPMIAKIVTHGRDREAAFAAMGRALAQTHAAGLVTNIAFLERLTANADMRAGAVDTGLIGRHLAALTVPAEPSAADWALAAAALGGLLEPDALTGWRAWGPGRSCLTIRCAETPGMVILCVGREAGTGALLLEADTPAGPASVRAMPLGGVWWRLGEDAPLALHRDPLGLGLVRADGRLRFDLPDPLAGAEEERARGDAILAPLPGILRSIAAAPGERVSAGQILAVMEAMKMEHGLAAPRDGVVAQVMAEPGEQVAEGTVLIALEPEPEP